MVRLQQLVNSIFKKHKVYHSQHNILYNAGTTSLTLISNPLSHQLKNYKDTLSNSNTSRHV
jgi:hypothetical protein